ncbi:MAG: hypothetical protein EOO52_13080 [Gammaproteobacteria bacterium]|nr:MAG: hypothetical protein EOO52_13080 [Gammaproteobacteria bacterium]
MENFIFNLFDVDSVLPNTHGQIGHSEHAKYFYLEESLILPSTLLLMAAGAVLILIFLDLTHLVEFLNSPVALWPAVPLLTVAGLLGFILIRFLAYRSLNDDQYKWMLRNHVALKKPTPLRTFSKQHLKDYVSQAYKLKFELDRELSL